MKVWTVINTMELTVTVYATREAAVRDTLEHFESMEIHIEPMDADDEDFMGRDDHGNPMRWAVVEEQEVHN